MMEFAALFCLIPALKVARLGLEERQPVGSLFGAVGDLEGELFCRTEDIGQLETKNLK
jgi:hypothetical protein